MNVNGQIFPLTAAAPAATLAPTAGGFGIYVDPATATQPAPLNPSNQAIQGNILATQTNNPSYQPRLHLANQPPLAMNYYWQQCTAPGDPRTVQQLQQQNPAAYQAAVQTSYRPQGDPAAVYTGPAGVQVQGEWHAGYLQHVYAQ
ncbi:hypothetical protein RAB80_014438 [Fusarium oxysporum f. sp. vasinfectum]|uniref:Uncharacterized protein n=1 Tax=Fusarium oxysporum f. sp. vasinfectum 25433 TaxID=1089449 RepID=X0KXS4_FUSOX|nr:hypothetical protein FOTG_17967 [Fusarium oxysporum f. sp. vasinfectum 25433]KAK2670301.1 hypothetical protein RAB80_014438 [Fusarium oxysporum f. sp. vasinfectum]KAK2926632.1 hypothetical protein FoTM2_013501 [Fusarium oxysporum f. sp. vasinfectum]